MSEYSINDFSICDQVYHLSDSSLRMVTLKIHTDLNEITYKCFLIKAIKLK